MHKGSVTLYHYKGDACERVYYPKASVYHKKAVSQTDGGFENSDTVTVRIFTQANIAAEPGDRIVLGYSEGILPPEDGVHTVTVVTDNRTGRGRSRHYRLNAR